MELVANDVLPAMTHQSPIFIHSLWRSGSTYIFQAFRRSPNGYYCFQEPIHEFVLNLEGDPYRLIDVGVDSTNVLRHPKLEMAYLQELFDTYDSWKGLLKKESIYDGYFLPTIDEPLRSYIEALIVAARGRPVIQECRTSSRIGSIRASLGGIHIYLWRNPWDQWWSFKATSYFNVVTLLALNATYHPEAVEQLRRSLGLEAFHNDSIQKEYQHFSIRPLSPEGSYKAFFMLWSLGWLEGKRAAHAELNIDLLSASDDYRNAKIEELRELGIGGLDFSDANIHQSIYFDLDASWFSKLEKDVLSILMASGVAKTDLDAMVDARRNGQPSIHANSPSRPRNALEDDLARLRDIVLRESREGSERTEQIFDYLRSREDFLSENISTEAQHVAELMAQLDAALNKVEDLERRLDLERDNAQQAGQKAIAEQELGWRRYNELVGRFNDQLEALTISIAYDRENAHDLFLKIVRAEEQRISELSEELGRANRKVEELLQSLTIERDLARQSELREMEYKANTINRYEDLLHRFQNQVENINKNLVIENEKLNAHELQKDLLYREAKAIKEKLLSLRKFSVWIKWRRSGGNF